jgi:hypothetical protein
MAPPNNFRIVRASFIMQRDTRQIVNTCHFYKSAGWLPADLVTLGAALQTWWTTYYAPMVPSSISLVNIHLQVYDPTGNPYVYDRNVSPPVVGGRGSTPEAGNVSLSLSLRAGLAGRAYRGRMYLAALPTGDTAVNDVVSSFLISLAATAITALIGPSLPPGVAAVIFHRNDNLFSTVVAGVIENIVDSQRRRLPGRGR